MDDIQSRAVYIKNWQMHFSVEFLILWMIMKPCAWAMMSQVNILVLNSHARLACYTMNKTGVASGSFS